MNTNGLKEKAGRVVAVELVKESVKRIDVPTVASLVFAVPATAWSTA